MGRWGVGAPGRLTCAAATARRQSMAAVAATTPGMSVRACVDRIEAGPRLPPGAYSTYLVLTGPRWTAPGVSWLRFWCAPSAWSQRVVRYQRSRTRPSGPGVPVISVQPLAGGSVAAAYYLQREAGCAHELDQAAAPGHWASSVRSTVATSTRFRSCWREISTGGRWPGRCGATTTPVNASTCAGALSTSRSAPRRASVCSWGSARPKSPERDPCVTALSTSKVAADPQPGIAFLRRCPAQAPGVLGMIRTVQRRPVRLGFHPPVRLDQAPRAELFWSRRQPRHGAFPPP